MSLSRRGFLGVAGAAAAGAALAPGIRLIELADARPPEEAASALHRWGLLVDTTKCSEGCDACVTACNEEHGLTSLGRPQTDAQWIRKVTLKDKQTGHVTTLPMLCMHCAEPPCVDVCPTGASFKRVDGIVLVDKHTCIGCRYCMMACPYKARSFIHEDITGQKPYAPRGKGTVESCTLCVERVDTDRIPACVEACNAEDGKALQFGDLNNPTSKIAKRLATEPSTQIRADLNLNTGVRYQGI
ncbi:MAG: 4Fe-4S dicluster domain-containing protein [Gammaproteobacteria bacterium]|nr:MAG: 4Fe-4S dicluster domain-containing protein [Gammaproteobacteria bacterium]